MRARTGRLAACLGGLHVQLAGCQPGDVGRHRSPPPPPPRSPSACPAACNPHRRVCLEKPRRCAVREGQEGEESQDARTHGAQVVGEQKRGLAGLPGGWRGGRSSAGASSLQGVPQRGVRRAGGPPPRPILAREGQRRLANIPLPQPPPGHKLHTQPGPADCIAPSGSHASSGAHCTCSVAPPAGLPSTSREYPGGVPLRKPSPLCCSFKFTSNGCARACMQ